MKRAAARMAVYLTMAAVLTLALPPAAAILHRSPVHMIGGSAGLHVLRLHPDRSTPPMFMPLTRY